MKGIIDRFEADKTVVELENGCMADIPRSRIPKGAKEGSAILIKNEEITLLDSETHNLRLEVEKLMEDTFED